MTGDRARRLHESTKHGTPPAEPDRLVPYRRLDPHNAPAPFKKYLDLESSPLPRDLRRSDLSATAVLGGQTGKASPFDARMLTTLLFLSDGVTRRAGAPGHRSFFRTAMSAGNLHPVEVYVVTGDVSGLEAGVYHFSPLEVALTRLRRGEFRSHLGTDCSVTMILTGIPWRTTWKYGERGLRHLYWDAGTILANLLAVADAHGVPTRVVFGFEDRQVTELLGIDGIREMPLVLVELGPAASTVLAPSRVDPLVLEVEPVAPRPIRLPLVEEAQAGGVLRGDQVDSWRRAGGHVRQAASGGADPPQESPPIEEVILRRGSTRRMLRQTVRREDFEWPMAAATRAVGGDVIGEETLLDEYVNVHAVEGVEPGAYRYTPTDLQPIRRHGSLREISAGLSLGQALGGDSAYTVFHCAGLDPLLDSLGPRGYRVAQLEAGVVSGRLALCAFAVGLGATGLTFYDDAVSEFFGTAAQPMLVTAVGVPATGPAPAGAPGEPATLRR